jgi:hypothetical protein
MCSDTDKESDRPGRRTGTFSLYKYFTFFEYMGMQDKELRILSSTPKECCSLKWALLFQLCTPSRGGGIDLSIILFQVSFQSSTSYCSA